MIRRNIRAGAAALLLAALPLAGALADAPAPSLAAATLLQEQGHYRDAQAMLEALLPATRATAGDGHPDTQAVMLSLATVYAKLRRDEDALRLRESVWSLRRQQLGDTNAATLEAMSDVATSYSALGRTAEALDLKVRALQAWRVLAGERSPKTLGAMGDLAATLTELGRHADALALKEARLAASREVLGPEHPSTLIAMGNLAATYSDLGRHEEAVALKQERLRISQLVLGESHPSTLVAMGNLASSYSELGRHDDARVFKAWRLRVSLEVLGERHPSTLIAMGSLSRTLDALGLGDEAVALQSRRLALSRELLGESHPDTMTALERLGALHAKLGHDAEALATLAQYVAAAEQRRADPGLTPANRRALFAKLVPSYRMYARLLEDSGDHEAAFRLAELSKARTLLESTALSQASRSGALPREERLKLDRLQVDAELVEDALAKAGSDLSLRLEIERERLAIQAAFATLQADLKARFPRYAQQVDVRILGAGEGATQLPPDTLFVSYLPTDDGWLVFALDGRGEFTTHRISAAAASDLDGQLAAYRAWLTATGPQPGVAGGDWRGLARKGDAAGAPSGVQLAEVLADTLLGPVAARLAQYRHVVFSPDDMLATLPFESLPFRGAPLVASHDVSYAQSLSVYALLRERGKEYARLRGRKPLLAVGNPVYAPVTAGRAGEAVDEQRLLGMVTRGADGSGAMTEAYDYLNLTWPELPGTARELAAVEEMFGVTAIQREHASEQNLRKMSREGGLERYRYLLFSAHGYLSLQEPALSALVLSQGEASRDAEHDGYVSASEWPMYRLKSDLLVLSACETALGKQSQGEGIMGLPYALYIAGNRNTVLTLWSIDDDASAEFVRRFFGKLRDGVGETQALNETKREFIADDALSAPRYWAPFVMYGS